MTTRDTMELKEETIRAQYDAALGLLAGFDHAPRLARAAEVAAPERSPGIGTRPRFRSTTPGLVTRPSSRPGGVRLLDRVEGMADGLISPQEAAVLNAMRRGLAIALAMGGSFADATALEELKKANLEGRLPDLRRTEFTELLAAEALVSLFTFANATAFLLAPHLGALTVEVGTGASGRAMGTGSGHCHPCRRTGTPCRHGGRLLRGAYGKGRPSGRFRPATGWLRQRVVEGRGGWADAIRLQARPRGQGRTDRHAVQETA
jgi:hypothetical protein